MGSRKVAPTARRRAGLTEARGYERRGRRGRGRQRRRKWQRKRKRGQGGRRDRMSAENREVSGPEPVF
jgi:hypothetical protein